MFIWSAGIKLTCLKKMVVNLHFLAEKLKYRGRQLSTNIILSTFLVRKEHEH